MIYRIPIDELKAQTQLKEELDRFNRFNKGVLKMKDKEVPKKVDIRDFPRYILKEGGRRGRCWLAWRGNWCLKIERSK